MKLEQLTIGQINYMNRNLSNDPSLLESRLLMDQFRPWRGDMQSMRLVEQIHPEYHNLPKIFS